MKYAFVKENQKSWSIGLQCRVLQVSRPGYYAWSKRATSQREQANKILDEKILGIFKYHKSRYGSPRITEELKDQGEQVNHKRVEKRMKTLEIRAKQAKKFKCTTDSNHDKPIAKNLLEQDFSATAPNQKWVGDITYVWTQSGWLYLAVVLDLYSRQVIGWSMSPRINKKLVCDALTMALWRRHFPKDVIVHTDRGSQYCSKRYQQLIKDNHLVCSMSGRGNCYDNAVAESYFHSLKVECLHGQHFVDRPSAQKEIFEYIEIYYNQQRKHSALGYKTPSQFEALFSLAS